MKSSISYNIVCEIVQLLHSRKVIQSSPKHQLQMYILITVLAKMCGPSYICNIRWNWDMMITRWHARKIFRLCSERNTRLARGLNLSSPFHTGPNHMWYGRKIAKAVLNLKSSLNQYFNQFERGHVRMNLSFVSTGRFLSICLYCCVCVLQGVLWLYIELYKPTHI